MFLTGVQQPAEAKEPQMVTLKALLIQAQNESAPIDRRLEKVEYKLRRVFGFQFYKYVGEGTITLPGAGSGSIDLPDGYRLNVRLKKGGKVEVHWVKDEKALLSTSVSVSKKAPVVLGGIPSNGGKLILVLTQE